MSQSRYVGNKLSSCHHLQGEGEHERGSLATNQFVSVPWSNQTSLYAGMTMLELAVSAAIFSMVLVVSYQALQSMRDFSRTNLTQVDLQEEARHALEDMATILQNAGRFTDAPSTRTYPTIYPAGTYPDTSAPNGYNSANQHPPKTKPKARPGTNVNGGDPTLNSAEIIFKIPQAPDASNPAQNADPLKVDPLHLNYQMPKMNGLNIQWTAEEYGLFILPVRADMLTVAGAGESDPNITNMVVFRNSQMPPETTGQRIQGWVIARWVDRIQIQEYNNSTDASLRDPTLTSRQLRLTLYLSRLLDPAIPNKVITVALSAVVDMRNNQLQ